MELGPNQKAWVDALRSGNYQQGTEVLHSITNEVSYFCCLGVLCEMNKEHLDVMVVNRMSRVITEYDHRQSFLPSKLVGAYGFHDDLGLNIVDDEKTLAALNDACDYSFSDIADIIEANPEHYFSKEY